MLKFLLITSAVVGVVAICGIAWAKHNGYCSSGDYVQHIAERVSRKLDLNGEQTTKLQTLTETLHRLENPGDKDVHLIEVQTGDYFGEDDIQRFEDIYGRVK